MLGHCHAVWSVNASECPLSPFHECACSNFCTCKVMSFLARSLGNTQLHPVHTVDVSCISTYVHFTEGSSRDSYRLVGGRGDFEGRVEVKRSGEWQTLCGLLWDINDAEVLCWELGYEYAVSAVTGAGFGQGAGTVWEVGVACSGGESSISNCATPSSQQPCSHNHDAGVVCSNASKISIVEHQVCADCWPPCACMAGRVNCVEECVEQEWPITITWDCRLSGVIRYLCSHP